MGSKVLTKKGKIIKALIITLATLGVLAGVALYVFKTLTTEPVIPTYSFSGYVYSDGEPLAGATVSCGVASTTTDDSGYYTFDGLTKVVEVSVSKEGYLFGNELVFVNSDKLDVNFDGFQIFDMNGIVKSDDQIIPFAKIVASSQVGTYVTTANEFGEFYLPELAGKVKISATLDDMKFFDQEFGKEKEELIISGTTNISGSIDIDYDGDCDFKLTLDGKTIAIDSDRKFSVSNVTPNSVLVLESENYYIKNPEIAIIVENKNIVFAAEKYYSVVGAAKSGNTLLSNVKFNVGGKIVYTDANGSVVVDNLHGDVNVLAYSQDYLFEDVAINATSESFEVIGKFGITGTISSDDGNINGFEISNGILSTTTNRRGEFVLSGLQLGDKISVITDDYYVSNNNIALTNKNKLNFNLSKFYSLNVNVSYDSVGLNNVTLIMNDNNYSLVDGKITIDNLHGENDIQLSCNGYRFANSYSISYTSNNLNITPDKYFTLSGTIHSGEIILDGAEIKIGNDIYYADSNGEFEIYGLYQNGFATISHADYNDYLLEYSLLSNQFDINLNYDIAGRVVCGDNAVVGVSVNIGETYILTDDNGYFEFNGLSGSQNIELSKDYYSFDIVSVNCNGNITVPTTYSVSGYAFDNNTPIAGLKIVIAKNDTTFIAVEEYTDENGYYEFSGLSGEYLLFFQSDSGIDLLPNSYTIVLGGRYNFANIGYKFSGRITCGSDGVAGVSVRAGETVVTTDSDGYYAFELLLEEETLVLEKNGYTFDNNNIIVNSELYNDRTDVNFTCTYEVKGFVKSGNTPLEGVEISIAEKETETNENGYYCITGLTGKNNISLSLYGFTFLGSSSVSVASECNYNGTILANIVVKTGSIAVGNAVVTIAGKNYTTNSSGLINISGVVIGDIISISKDGYAFQNMMVLGYQSAYEFDGLYSVYGTVSVGGNLLKNATLTCNGVTFVTGDNGYYEFCGLNGSQTISIEHSEFDFDNVTVTGHRELNILAKYSITGQVKVAGKAIEGVKVTTSTQEVYTDASGNFRINNLQSEEELKFEKTGYVFDEEYIVLGATHLDVIGKYSISGIITSGDLIISGATITLSNGMVAESDNNGLFTITGILNEETFVVSKDKYNTSTSVSVDGYTQNMKVNLTYNVSFSLSGLIDYSDISVTINGQNALYSGSSITIENLSGTSLISLAKGDKYLFSPAQVQTTSASTYSVVAKQKYSISGKATTKGNIAISGAIITAGNQSVVTNKEGLYRIDNLIDSNVVTLKLSAGDYVYEESIEQVSGDAIVNPSINNYPYAFYMFKRGYALLDSAKTYQIQGSGSVSAVVTVIGITTTQNQNVSVRYKKDANNIRLFENLNYGKPVDLVGVDPRVSMLVAVDMNTKQVKYQHIKGETVLSNLTTTYSDKWTDIADSAQGDYNTFQNNFGTNPVGYYPYVINSNTVNSITDIELVDNDTYNSKDFVFTINLKTTSDMYYYYEKQMSVMCPDQKLNRFESVALKYTINADGYIRSLIINEKYYVDASGQTATCTANFNYTFYTFGQNESIPNIDLTDNTTIQNSLAIVTPTKVSTIGSEIDIAFIDDKRRFA